MSINLIEGFIYAIALILSLYLLGFIITLIGRYFTNKASRLREKYNKIKEVKG